MKKIIFLWLVLVTATYSAMACNICGCQSSGLMYVDMGLGKNQTIGLRHLSRQYQAKVHHPTVLNAYSDLQERIQQVEVMANVRFSKHWGVFISMPYVWYQMTQDDAVFISSKLGEGIAVGAYTFSLNKNTLAKTTHNLSLKAGVKLPAMQPVDTQQIQLLNPITTGTLDLLYGIDYTLNSSNWLSKSSILYKMNGLDKLGNKKGNMLNIQQLMHYQFVSKPVLLVGIGSSLDLFGKETFIGILEKESGGYIWNLYPSIALKWNKLSLAYQPFVPIKQDFKAHILKQKINSQLILTLTL